MGNDPLRPVTGRRAWLSRIRTGWPGWAVLHGDQGNCLSRAALGGGRRFTVLMSLLGEALRARREELRLGQEQVADKLGVSQQTVSRWEKGLALPRPSRVSELAVLLDLDGAHLHRLAGYLPEHERSARNPEFLDAYAGISEMTRPELMLLMDRVWQELRRREELHPGGTT